MTDLSPTDDHVPTGGGPAGAGPTAAVREPRRFGCLAKVLVFVLMLGLGAFAAAKIRGRDTASTTTIEKGTVGSVAWQVQASVDEQRSRCVQLYANGTTPDDQVTGGCITSNGKATGDDVHEGDLPGTGRWVIFGQAPKGTRQVTLSLNDGSTKELSLVDTTTDKDGYYVWVAPKGVHTNGPATFS